MTMPRIGALRFTSPGGEVTTTNPGEQDYQLMTAIAKEWWDGDAWQPYKPADIQVHLSPSYPPGCKHEWPHDREVRDSDCCAKCGMSFTRYIFMDMP